LPHIDTPIGKRIAHYRKLQGFSQEALAEKMGLSQRQIATYETGRTHLNDEMIIRFALILKVPTDELLGLKSLRSSADAPALRMTRRICDLSRLPEPKRKAILRTLDDLIRANS